MLAGIAAALAVWFLSGSGPPLARLVVLPAQPSAPGASGATTAWVHRSAALALVPLGFVVDGPRGAALGFAGSLVVLTLTVLALRHRARRARRRRQQQVVLAAETMAGLLGAGRVPTLALQEAADEVDLLRPAVSDLQTGGDIPAALRRAGGVPGSEGLVHLANAWQVAARSGAPQVQAWEQAAEALAAEDEVARLVTSEVAAARAAGRVMGVLPLAGIALGYLMGADPADFLLAGPVGWICLIAATGLACIGVLWIDAISDSAGRRA